MQKTASRMIRKGSGAEGPQVSNRPCLPIYDSLKMVQKTGFLASYFGEIFGEAKAGGQE